MSYQWPLPPRRLTAPRPHRCPPPMAVCFWWSSLLPSLSCPADPNRMLPNRCVASHGLFITTSTYLFFFVRSS
ncbi:hypothetical protein ZEAMMB73_Zm00001d045940 [Zea mays]|uniref:Uncharacterized protein n=1 Tax=Zea mays TaxID=4577 RepID=A0A1D6NZY0_MAIZE|nr:hypothetical protein ZEAMMB73_Zm00001d045940 [Zea mays]